MPELRLDDGARRIFINTKGKNPEGFTEEFLELMEYINHTTDEVAEKVKSEKIKKIHDRVRTVKGSEKVGVKLMQKWEELAYAREEGELEGEKKGELVLLVSLVCRKIKRGLTPETIADQLERELPEIKRICDVIEDTADYDEKKIVEKLKELKENDYEKYLKFFQVYGDFLKFGIYSTYGAKKDDLQDLLVFDSLLSEKKISFKDYVDKLKEDQKNIYYASGKTKESILMLPEMKHYKDAGIDVLLLCENIDEFTLQVLGDYASHSFKNITEEDKDSLSDDEKKQIEDLVNNNKRFVDDMTTSLKGKVDEVTFSLKLGDAPVSISSKNGLSLNMENTLNNQAEARKEPESKVKATKVLNLNPNHPLFEKISKVQDEEEVKKIASVLYDEAMMLEGFEIEDKQEFLKNLIDLLTKAY